MEKETVELFLNYGVLGIMGWTFLNYIKKMLDQTLESQKEFQKDIYSTLIMLKNQIVKGYLTNDTLLDIAKSKYLHSMTKYQKQILKYFLRNNIAVNKKTIITELEDFIYSEANLVGVFFKDKATNLYADAIKKIVLEDLEKSNEIVFNVFNNISNKKCGDYNEVAREVESELQRIQTLGLEKLEHIME